MSQVKTIQVQITVKADTVVRMADKEKMFTAFSNLPPEDQNRMTEIMKNPKALKSLAANWLMLKAMF